MVVPAWVDHMLTRIDDSPSADIALLVLRQASPDAPGKPAGPRTLVSKRLLRMLEMHGAPAAGSALQSQSIEDRYARVPSIRVNTEMPEPAQHLAATEATQIRAHEIDVLLGIDFNLAPGDTETIARHGVWSLFDIDGREPLDLAAGFWEVLEGEPTTGATLVMCNGDPENRVMLARTQTATHPTSVAVTRETLFWGASSLIPRQLVQLHRLGGDALKTEREKPADPPARPARNVARASSLSTPQLAAYLLRLFAKRLKRSIHYRLFEEQWHLRYAFEDSPSNAFRHFELLEPSRDRYWADPMPLYHEGRWHIFFEDFRHANKCGHISVISFDENRQPLPPRDALVRPYHLSYPFVFHWNDKLWMIPETASTRAVEIYECVGFPDQWELRRRVLEDRYIVDATLEHHGNTWYLFANEAKSQRASSWTEAFLYVNKGDLLDGNWEPHPQSPIRSDVTCARPAGPLFSANQVLFRPSQDCSIRYGGAMAIHQITELSPQRYAERVVDRIRPDWEPGLRGTHSYSHRPGLTVIDVMREVPRPGILDRLPKGLQQPLIRLLETQPRTGS